MDKLWEQYSTLKCYLSRLSFISEYHVGEDTESRRDCFVPNSLLTRLSLRTRTHSLKRAYWISLFVFFAQHICIFFQWLSLACDFTCLFCKVPWVWIGGSFSTPDEHRLRGQSIDRGPFCWRWVSVLFLSLTWLISERTSQCVGVFDSIANTIWAIVIFSDQAKLAKLFSAWHF